MVYFMPVWGSRPNCLNIVINAQTPSPQVVCQFSSLFLFKTKKRR